MVLYKQIKQIKRIKRIKQIKQIKQIKLVKPIKPIKLVNQVRRLQRLARYCSTVVRLKARPIHAPALVVCGSPRSGTTWIGTMLAESADSILLFEPLHPRRTPAGDHGFGWGEFLDPDTISSAQLSYLRRVLQGKCLNSWTVEEQSIRRSVSASRLLVKFVRANGLLSVLARDPGCLAPLVIVRHPLSTIGSQLREGSWKHPESVDLGAFIKTRPELAEAWQEVCGRNSAGQTSAGRISTGENPGERSMPEEFLAAQWAAEFIAATDPLTRGDWMVLHNEHVRTDPESSLRPVLAAWGCPEPSAAKSRAASRTASGGIVRDFGDHGLSPQQVDRVMATVARFGITAYGRSEEPVETVPFLAHPMRTAGF